MTLSNYIVKLHKFPVDTQVLSIIIESCECTLRCWAKVTIDNYYC